MVPFTKKTTYSLEFLIQGMLNKEEKEREYDGDIRQRNNARKINLELQSECWTYTSADAHRLIVTENKHNYIPRNQIVFKISF